MEANTFLDQKRQPADSRAGKPGQLSAMVRPRLTQPAGAPGPQASSTAEASRSPPPQRPLPPAPGQAWPLPYPLIPSKPPDSDPASHPRPPHSAAPACTGAERPAPRGQTQPCLRPGAPRGSHRLQYPRRASPRGLSAWTALAPTRS